MKVNFKDHFRTKKKKIKVIKKKRLPSLEMKNKIILCNNHLDINLKYEQKNDFNTLTQLNLFKLKTQDLYKTCV